MNIDYIQKKLFLIGMLLLVVSGLNVGIATITGRDIVSTLFGKNSLASHGICIAVGIAALGIGIYRDSYMPFLGQSVMPCSILKAQTPEGANVDVNILVKPGVKVLYWAAETATKDLEHLNNWREAYLGFKNAGVVIADDDGKAILRVRKPQIYTVPMKGALSQHIHYRICGDNGFIGKVETIKLDGKEMFENYVSRQEDHSEINEPNEFRYVNPKSALEEINNVTRKTLAESQMMEQGAFDESPQHQGALLSY